MLGSGVGDVSLSDLVVLVGLIAAIVSNLTNRTKLTDLHREVRNGTDAKDEDHETIRDLLTRAVALEEYTRRRNHDILGALSPSNATLATYDLQVIEELHEVIEELHAIREILDRTFPAPPAAPPQTPPT